MKDILNFRSNIRRSLIVLLFVCTSYICSCASLTIYFPSETKNMPETKVAKITNICFNATNQSLFKKNLIWTPATSVWNFNFENLGEYVLFDNFKACCDKIIRMNSNNSEGETIKNWGFQDVIYLLPGMYKFEINWALSHNAGVGNKITAGTFKMFKFHPQIVTLEVKAGQTYVMKTSVTDHGSSVSAKFRFEEVKKNGE